MDSEHFLFKKWYKDENNFWHHLYVEQFLWYGTELFYHCVIDGVKSIDIELVNSGWEDVVRLDGKLAKELGAIIKNH